MPSGVLSGFHQLGFFFFVPYFFLLPQQSRGSRHLTIRVMAGLLAWVMQSKVRAWETGGRGGRGGAFTAIRV